MRILKICYLIKIPTDSARKFVVVRGIQLNDTAVAVKKGPPGVPGADGQRRDDPYASDDDPPAACPWRRPVAGRRPAGQRPSEPEGGQPAAPRHCSDPCYLSRLLRVYYTLTVLSSTGLTIYLVLRSTK